MATLLIFGYQGNHDFDFGLGQLGSFDSLILNTMPCRIPTSFKVSRRYTICKFSLIMGFELVISLAFEPWLLSNIVVEDTNNAPEHLHPFNVLERSGIRVGIIGLVEEFVFRGARIVTIYISLFRQRLDQHGTSMAIQFQVQGHGGNR